MATIPPPIDCGFNGDNIHKIISSLSFLIFIPALIINGIAVWVCMHLHSKSTFMVYLKNLVAADLLMIMTIPFRAAKDMPNAPLALKVFCCRYSDVIFYLCMYMSIILLGLISLDRFFKIVRPCGRLLGQNVVFSKILSASIWVALLTTVAIPTMVLTNQDLTNNTKGSCMRMKSKTGRHWHEGVVIFNSMIFWLVCVQIFFCYICITRKVIQSYRKSGSSNDKGMFKTKVRVFIVLVVFLVCFLPYHVIRIQYTKHQVTTITSCTTANLRITKRITLWTATMNVCLDPFIYFFLCKPFTNTLMKTLHFTSGTCNWLIRRGPDLTPRSTAQDDSSSEADSE